MIRQSTKENLKNTFNESLLILIYEFLGTFMMGTLFINFCKSSDTDKPKFLLIFQIFTLTNFQIPSLAQNLRVSQFGEVTNSELDKLKG